jgi:predicted nucleic acid-binding protein
MILCLDAHPIIWGIKRQAGSGQESMIEKADYFFRWADQQKHEIIIPTVVLAEILVHEPEVSRILITETLSKAFIIADFDTRAAMKYAQILYNRLPLVKRIADDNEISRQKMKIDHTIIATALVNHAACIYSYDRGLKAFAEGLIDIKEFPALPVQQPSLFPIEPTSGIRFESDEAF